jgi:nucleoside-diphosphate-sugar epimerase
MIAPVKATARFLMRHYGDTLTRLYQRYSVAQKVMKRAEQTMITIPGTSELSQLSRKVRYSISKAESMLGYAPRFSVDSGIELSARWLDHESLIAHRVHLD